MKVVATWLGERGKLIDQSAGHEPDFRIDYADGRVAIGEVGWHADEATQKMWDRIHKQEHPQQIELHEGFGRWAVSLQRGARIANLHRLLPALIADLKAEGVTDLRLSDLWQREALAARASQLGIDRIRLASASGPDLAIYMMPSVGFWVPTDPNVIVDWVESVLADPARSDTTRKLLSVNADERHVFLASGDATDPGAAERLRLIGDGVPTRSPQLDVGITHLWVVAQYGAGPVGLWTRTDGWSTVPVPAP